MSRYIAFSDNLAVKISEINSVEVNFNLITFIYSINKVNYSLNSSDIITLPKFAAADVFQALENAVKHGYHLSVKIEDLIDLMFEDIKNRNSPF